MLVEIFLGFAFLFMLTYYYITKKFNYFNGKNIAVSKPSFPFGSHAVKMMMMGKANLADYGQYIADEFTNEKVVGYFMFREPRFFINDEHLAKLITIKDFEHFTDIPNLKSRSKYFNNMLTNLTGDEWKRARSVMSNIFTGSSLRRMLPNIVKVGIKMEQHLEKLVVASSSGVAELDMKDLGADFGLDAIASNGFGIDVDSFKEPENVFRRMSLTLIGAEGYKTKGMVASLLTIVLCSAFPKFSAEVLKLDVIPKKAEDFFVDIIINTYRQRLASGEKRSDLIGLIVDAVKDAQQKKSSQQTYETEFEKDQVLDVSSLKLDAETLDLETMLVSNVLILFFAGFSTTSDGIAIVSHAMAKNQEYQQRVYEEIIDVIGVDGKVTTEKLAEMKYLEKFILEALRYSDIIKGLERICTKNYKIPGTEVVIEKGTAVHVFANSIAFNEDNHLNAGMFDPENFDAANVKNKFANMSFGQGPRGCIGMRYALYMVKIAMIFILRRYTLKPGVGLAEKLVFNVDFTGFQGGVPMKLEPRY